jgi:hypothetical protein
MGIEIPIVVFKPLKLYLSVRLRSAKGKSFEFGLGSKLVHELRSSAKSHNPKTPNNL